VASDGYLRFPHLHGELLTFVADDDVWLAPVSGGRAWRLSADRAGASHPRLSRDGAAVAWTSQRDGAAEVYISSVDGGVARRLTFWGDSQTQVRGWSPDGKVLATTAAGQPFSWFAWAYAVPTDGGGPRRLPYGPVSDLAVEPDAVALLTARHGLEPAFWKRYRGGSGGRLWLARAGDGATDGQRPPFTRLAETLAGQLDCPMIVAGRLVFLADHEGTGNLYSCDFDGGDLRRHTDHDGFYARNPSTDGRRVVYHCAGDIWLLDDLDGEAHPLDVKLGSAGPGRSPRLISADDHLGDLSCDYTGQASAIEVRGSVHWLTHRDGPARSLAVTPRGRLPRVLGRTGQVVWVSDTGGEQALEIVPAIAPAEHPRRLAAGQLGWVGSLAAAPDGATVAAAARDGRLFLVDVASGQVSELASATDGAITDLAYSPDSAWLAWSEPGPRPLSRIRLARVSDQTVTDATDGRFADTDPVFTVDGRHLAFLSRRSFDPVYDAHFFDLSFPFGSRPYLIPLAASTPSPFAPLPDGRPAGHGDSGDDGGDEPQGPVAVTVDVDGLAGRVVQVPVPEARYTALRPVKGGLAWLREPLSGALGEGAAELDGSPARASLERFDLDKRRCSELVSELDWFDVSGDGRRLVVSDHGELRVLSAERKEDPDESDDAFTIDLSRARFMADPAALWRHAYDEAGRFIRSDFWVADMAGVDWDAILGEYRPLLDRVSSPGDFTDLLWELFGELGTSHAYVRGARGAGRETPTVGLLGADVEPDGDGGWRITRVLPGESSDPRARSPLSSPGALARPGERLVAVDGQPVDSLAGPGPLLVGAANVPVELTLATADGAESRRIVVVPLPDDTRLRYQDWVASRRALVRELSDGRIGYLHVPDMMGEGWAHFHRDLRLEMTRDALIVDVRGNRGGHVSELVVEKLARRVLGWDVPRGLVPTTYPQDAPRGPVVTLTDEYAGSDGDIVTAAIRSLRLGPIVGTRTWGGVVGIDGSGHKLVDGTSITVPKYAFWFSEFGWDVENHGAEPDVEVLNSPDDWAAGRDCQLEAAVQITLEALDAKPAVTPPDTTHRPVKRRPPLPPRPARPPAAQIGEE
jgi:tricorn protease